jgi:dTMP kinase
MFITLEGIEGSGKTTQAGHIGNFLKRQGYDCVITREPGGTLIGKKIRAILLDPDSHAMDSLTELLLYFADRAQHVQEVVLPSITAGKTVLCDRYFDATLVYQGFARGVDTDFIRTLHRLILKDLKPDLTLILDLSPELGLRRAWEQIRAGERSGHEVRFENEALEFHQKVRQGYLKLASLEPERFRIVDAAKDQHQVRDEILKTIEDYLRRKK